MSHLKTIICKVSEEINVSEDFLLDKKCPGDYGFKNIGKAKCEKDMCFDCWNRKAK